MNNVNDNKQVAKISVFVTSLFVIFLSMSYAFLTSIITSNKLIGINSGVLDLVLEEENEITLENAYPMYDEVGMIQEDSYDFKIVNKTNNDTNYILKLKNVYPDSMKKLCSDLGEITTSSPKECRKVEYPEELRKFVFDSYSDYFNNKDYTEEDIIKLFKSMNSFINLETFEDVIDGFIGDGSYLKDTRVLIETYPDNYYFPELLSSYDVRYYLTKNGEGNEPKSLIDIKDNILDSGSIKGNETINYSLRLWIDSYVSRNEDIEGKVFSLKVEVEVSQKISKISATSTNQLVDEATLGDNCKTYDDGVDTFLVGKCENNYLWYSGKLWRVVSKNNETGNVKLVTENSITTISGYSTNNYEFENSYLDQWLNQEFLPTLNEEYLVTDTKWYTSNDIENRSSLDNYVTRTVGLLNPYEYNITYSKSDGIANYNTGYLNNYIFWYLLTSNITGFVSSEGNIVFDTNDYSRIVVQGGTNSNVRPSVVIKNNLKISNGSGSKSDPYILDDNNKKIVNGSTLISSRYSGEYVKFSNQLYRIVSVEDNLTKIKAVNVPKGYENIKFDESNGKEVNFANSTIKTKLEDYYQSLKISNESFYNMIEPNTTWYLGSYGIGASNYKSTVCVNYDENTSIRECSEKALSTTASIALPRVGEMFTVSYLNHEYLTLTVESGDYGNYVIAVNDFSGLIGRDTNYGYEVLPVMYLKSSVKISSNNEGNGTYENPYELELN